MIVTQLQETHRQGDQPYRPLCGWSGLPYATFMRWKGRIAHGQPLWRKPGPAPVAPLDLNILRAGLAELDHGQQRSRGSTALYRVHRDAISRREFSRLVQESRREVHRQHQHQHQRIEWLMPGAVWSMDPTELVLNTEPKRTKVPLLPVLDLASRYKFEPLVGERLTGQVVARRLDELFRRHGPPLVLKRDNGSNLNSAEVNEVLSHWLVIPLNSPRHYPPYNGGIEWSQRELKTALRPWLPAGLALGTMPATVTQTVHQLNHRPRRCLRGKTACRQFADANRNLSEYTRRMRKENYDRLREQAQSKIAQQPACTQAGIDAIWRRTVQTWLLETGIIAIPEPKSVTQFPEIPVS